MFFSYSDIFVLTVFPIALNISFPASFNVNNTLTPLSRDQLLKARGLLQELLLTVTGSNSAVQVDNRFDVGSQSYSCGNNTVLYFLSF